jgi:hypothetical protein
MANFSAAFGYKVYIMPLASSAVDVATVPTAPSGLGAGGFIDNTTVHDVRDSVVYNSGIFTIGGAAQSMDGTDTPFILRGLTNASLESDTGSEEVYTYDDETKGFSQAVATTKSFSLTLAGVADFKDAGYQALRLTEQNTVADSLRVKFARLGPTGTDETVFGYGTLTGYTESIEVTSIVSWECTLTGYGFYGLELDANP